jgi:ABC-type nitrate/sulfonate/bicarbonate transport system substrate-binding protein
MGVTLVAACGVLSPTVQEVEVTHMVETPAETVEIRAAYTAGLDLTDIPSLMAFELLADQGYAVLTTSFAQSELAVEALARGDSDFGFGSSRTYWAAVPKGANIVSIMERSVNDFSIVTVPEIRTCSDLDGRRFAQHSEGAVSKAMSDAYILKNCPGIEPEILIIPEGANRAAALLVGEIDATPLKLADSLQVERQAPGQYRTLANLAADLPHLKTGLVFVNRDFAAAHPQAVKDYIRAALTIHRQIKQVPDSLIAEATRRLAVDPEFLPRFVTAHAELDMWDVNGGLEAESVQYSLDFFTDAGKLDAGLTVDDVADLSYLNQVLDEIGRE